MKRVDAAAAVAVALFLVYAATLAPDVTFWDAGEFISAAHSLGIPHPPGTPLFILLANAWAKVLFFLPYAVATNLFSAAATALAAGVTARVVERATRSSVIAFAAALTAGAMSSVWLNATETEVYAASLVLGVLMIWAGDRAGREPARERWVLLTAYLMLLAVPLHLSALVAAPAAIVLAAHSAAGVRWQRAVLLGGALLLAMGLGRMATWLVAAGAFVVILSAASQPIPDFVRRLRLSVAALIVAALAGSALAFLYYRASFDPAINQGNPDTLAALADMVARRQYTVAPMWPREAPIWIQLGNFGQYADWQFALSLGPTVMPAPFRILGTLVFVAIGWVGAVAHWRADRRTWIGVMTLFLCGSLGVLVYLNLHAGPSIAPGLAADTVREARERDYFFVFAFWAWGIWAGFGAVSVATRLRRPAWTGIAIASLPVVLNWRAVTRRAEPERLLPRTLAAALLEATPRNGVLFATGDNDSYPLWHAQQVLGLRRDVAVITIPLLPTRWYRAQIAGRFGLLDTTHVQRYAGTLDAAAAIARAAERAGRPVAASMTLTTAERLRLAKGWIASGLVYVSTSPPRALDGDRRGGGSDPPEVEIDSAAVRRWADWVEQRLGHRAPRDAIDPVHSYFRRMLDCPRQFANAAAGGDSTRLDSVCNYK